LPEGFRENSRRKTEDKMDSIDTIAALVLGRRRAMFGMKSTGD